MRVLALLALALVPCTGCSVEAGGAQADLGPSGGSGSGGTGSIIGEQPTRLTFLDGPTDLTPREPVTLTVQATPPGLYTIRFALPSTDDADPQDAVLAQSEVPTDETGKASVLLTAPSAGGQFSVRASVAGSVLAELDLTVTDRGSVAVVVQPMYAGKRDIKTWAASARLGTCADHPGIPSPDGPYTGLAGKLEAPEISDVPAGVPVAITLRSGDFVGGCTSIEMFPPGGRHVVQVTVLNRPIELAQSSVSLALGLDADDTAFLELNDAASASVLTALRGASTDDADALLDVMRNALEGVARQNLDSARKTELWDDLVRAHWAGSGSRLHDTASAWLASGTAQLSGSSELLEGALRPVDGKSAELTLAAVAGLDPVQAGFVSSALVSWSAGADDTVVLGTDLYLSTSRFATGLATPAALLAQPGAETVEQALALALECGALASVLATAGSDSVLAYEGCDAACLNLLCEQAGGLLWQRARDASSLKPARLALTAAGAANVGDGAELAGINGTWVGELVSSTGATGGSLTATAD